MKSIALIFALLGCTMSVCAATKKAVEEELKSAKSHKFELRKRVDNNLQEIAQTSVKIGRLESEVISINDIEYNRKISRENLKKTW